MAWSVSFRGLSLASFGYPFFFPEPSPFGPYTTRILEQRTKVDLQNHGLCWRLKGACKNSVGQVRRVLLPPPEPGPKFLAHNTITNPCSNHTFGVARADKTEDFRKIRSTL
jgi:hypothetical protein